MYIYTYIHYYHSSGFWYIRSCRFLIIGSTRASEGVDVPRSGAERRPIAHGAAICSVASGAAIFSVALLSRVAYLVASVHTWWLHRTMLALGIVRARPAVWYESLESILLTPKGVGESASALSSRARESSALPTAKPAKTCEASSRC